jgi:hypothetical protein
MAIIKDRVISLAAAALRAIRAMGEAGDLGTSFASPTPGRLAGMIDDFAPNTAGALIASDDRVRRFCYEMISAAERYANAKPETMDGSGPFRAGALFRTVGLAGRGLAA